jgi:exonuclease III
MHNIISNNINTNHNILQWNINGFHKTTDDLKILILKYSPLFICLQETNFIKNHTPELKGYLGHSKNRSIRSKASGGASIYANSSFPSEEIKITSNFEVTAITVFTKEKITICNIYLPNQHDFEIENLENIINQLPQPYILTGDFNSHNTLRGSNHIDMRGKKIEKMLDYNYITLLNDGSPTHFNAANGSLSAIDLSFSSVNISTNIEWGVEQELYNSDHWPIIIKIYNRDSTLLVYETKNKWNLKKPN